MGSRTRKDAGCPAVNELTGEQEVLGVCSACRSSALAAGEKEKPGESSGVAVVCSRL